MERFWRGTREGTVELLPLWRWPYDAAVYTWQTARLFVPFRSRLFLRRLNRSRG